MQVINEALDTRAAIQRATVFTNLQRIRDRDVATFTGAMESAVRDAARKWADGRYSVTASALLQTQTGFSLTVTDNGCD